jgi:imidazolonepropionase-like amidohydrolase
MTGGAFLGCEVDGVDEARSAARKQLKAGADHLKLFATSGSLNPPGRQLKGLFGAPQLTVEEMRTVVEVGKNAGIRTGIHALGREGIINAVKAKPISIEHATMADDEAISMMLDEGIYLVPTLGCRYRIAKYGKDVGLTVKSIEIYQRMLDKGLRVLQKAYERSAKISFGTDGGTVLMPHEELVSEAKCMMQAGMTPMHVLQSMTSSAACLLGMDKEIGTIEVGKKADLVLINGNPLENIEDLERIDAVIKEGEIKFR